MSKQLALLAGVLEPLPLSSPLTLLREGGLVEVSTKEGLAPRRSPGLSRTVYQPQRRTIAGHLPLSSPVSKLEHTAGRLVTTL